MPKKKRSTYRPREADAADWQRSRGREMVDLPGDEAGTRVRVVQAPHDRYRARGYIDDRQHWAAARLVQDYELGICGARDPEAKGGDGDPVTVAQVMAARAYAMAVWAMGKILSSIVIAVILCERPMREVERQQRIPDGKGSELLRSALTILADHYDGTSLKREIAA